jgi:DNA-binding MarR family transcriptional regulator
LSTQAIRREGTEVEAFAALLRAHAATTRAFNAELVAEHGLTLSDYEVLLRLARAPDRRLRRVDLAGQVLLTPSGITRLLAGLEQCGYVERVACASDARVTYAQLTEDGRAKLLAASKTHLESVRSVFSERLTPSEREALRDLLQRLPLDDAVSCEP